MTDFVPEPTLTLEISPPIKAGDREYDQLILREPKVIEVRQADMQLRNGVHPESLRNRSIHLVSRVSGTPVTVVEQLPISTLNRATAYLNGFLELGQAIGEI
jgi:hypothetical protein